MKQKSPLGIPQVKDWPLVSIVVLNYNGRHHLETCLNSLLRTNYPNFKIILVDNASSDGSVEWIAEKYPQIKILRNSINKGAAGGYNTGIRCTKCKYIAILNNDIEVDRNWLRPLVWIAENHRSIGAVDSKYLDFYRRTRFETTSAAGRFLDYFVNIYARGAGKENSGVYDKPCRVFAALTLFRKSVLFEIGLFDEGFFFGYEDIDLSWRINLRGYKVYYCPSSIIYHKSGSTTTVKGGRKPEFYLLDKRNRLITSIKNYSIKTLIFVIPVILFEYLGLLGYWILKGEKTYSICVIKAILQVAKSFKNIWRKHVLVRQIRRVSDSDIRKIMIPYFGYFRGLLKFNEE